MLLLDWIGHCESLSICQLLVVCACVDSMCSGCQLVLAGSETRYQCTECTTTEFIYCENCFHSCRSHTHPFNKIVNSGLDLSYCLSGATFSFIIKNVRFILFHECCSRCSLEPCDCVIICFLEWIQSTFKFCQWARVDNVVHGLSLATITGR